MTHHSSAGPAVFYGGRLTGSRTVAADWWTLGTPGAAFKLIWCCFLIIIFNYWKSFQVENHFKFLIIIENHFKFGFHWFDMVNHGLSPCLNMDEIGLICVIAYTVNCLYIYIYIHLYLRTHLTHSTEIFEITMISSAQMIQLDCLSTGSSSVSHFHVEVSQVDCNVSATHLGLQQGMATLGSG